MYATINDAVKTNPIFAPGTVKIWYVNDNKPGARDFRFGDVPDNMKANIANTHVLLGSIKGAANLDDIFCAMQGENWSPEGEARELIRSAGAYHTSMSVGDVIEDENGVFFAVAGCDFTVL